MRCGEGGGRGGSAFESWRRGGRAHAGVPKSARVCGERESGEGREEEGGSGHFYPKVGSFTGGYCRRMGKVLGHANPVRHRATHGGV